MMINLNATVSVFGVQWIDVESFDHEMTSFARAYFRNNKKLE